MSRKERTGGGEGGCARDSGISRQFPQGGIEVIKRLDNTGPAARYSSYSSTCLLSRGDSRFNSTIDVFAHSRVLHYALRKYRRGGEDILSILTRIGILKNARFHSRIRRRRDVNLYLTLQQSMLFTDSKIETDVLRDMRIKLTHFPSIV